MFLLGMVDWIDALTPHALPSVRIRCQSFAHGMTFVLVAQERASTDSDAEKEGRAPMQVRNLSGPRALPRAPQFGRLTRWRGVRGR